MIKEKHLKNGLSSGRWEMVSSGHVSNGCRHWSHKELRIHSVNCHNRYPVSNDCEWKQFERKGTRTPMKKLVSKTVPVIAKCIGSNGETSRRRSCESSDDQKHKRQHQRRKIDRLWYCQQKKSASREDRLQAYGVQAAAQRMNTVGAS